MIILKLAGFLCKKRNKEIPLQFQKPALSFTEQLDQLIDRGLVVEDRDKALHYLSHLNYYRLGAYWLPFEENRAPHKFYSGTSFETILNHYLFDRELRLHLLDAIERIEVSFRTQWAYQVSLVFGSHGYLLNKPGIIKNTKRFDVNVKELTKAVLRSDDTFIEHYQKKYDEGLPPAWVACEIMSLGLLSKFYSNLRAYQVRRAIASAYDFDEGFLEGFMEHLTYVRNVCAHHGRLWNRHLKKKMPIPKSKPQGLRDSIYIDTTNKKTEHKIYNTFVLVQYLVCKISPNSNWSTGLYRLIEKYEVNTVAMGFPEDWLEKPIWLMIDR